MALGKFHTIIQDTAGNIITGVSCAVKLAGTATNATLFTNLAGTIALANPFINDVTYGSADFYAEEGAYDITFTKSGHTFQPLNGTPIAATTWLRVTVDVPAVNAAALLTASGLIPANARVVAVFVTNKVALGSSNGLTGYHVGDSTLLDRWSGRGGPFPLTLNFKSTQGDFGSQELPIYNTASDVLISAVGGNFDATGTITVEVVYRLDTAT